MRPTTLHMVTSVCLRSLKKTLPQFPLEQKTNTSFFKIGDWNQPDVCSFGEKILQKLYRIWSLFDREQCTMSYLEKRFGYSSTWLHVSQSLQVCRLSLPIHVRTTLLDRPPHRALGCLVLNCIDGRHCQCQLGILILSIYDQSQYLLT